MKENFDACGDSKCGTGPRRQFFEELHGIKVSNRIDHRSVRWNWLRTCEVVCQGSLRLGAGCTQRREAESVCWRTQTAVWHNCEDRVVGFGNRICGKNPVRSPRWRKS